MKIYLIFGAICAVLYVTNPGRAELREEVSRAIVLEMENTPRGDDPAIDLIAITCTTIGQSCGRLLENLLTYRVSDLLIAQIAEARMNDKPYLACIGALNKWWCLQVKE